MKIFTFFLFLAPILGEEAKYQAALIVDGERFCSGAAIFKHFVITAAQCVFDAFEVDVLLSSSDLFDPGFISISTEIYISNFNDVALIKLSRSFTGEKVRFNKNYVHPRNKLDSSGWQRINGSKTVIGELYTERIDIFNDDHFLSLVCHGYDKYFCVKIGINADLGAPLVDKNKLYGIVTKKKRGYNIATNVAYYSEWINSVINAK